MTPIEKAISVGRKDCLDALDKGVFLRSQDAAASYLKQVPAKFREQIREAYEQGFKQEFQERWYQR